MFLTGMMGSGKSTVARVLGECTGCDVIDMDVRIERMFGETIDRLFSRGEVRFRALERVALSSLATELASATRSVVVATGGGVVLDPANLVTMHATGVTVFLDVPVDVLADRLRNRAGRPLLDGAVDLEDRLSQLLAGRLAAYRACRFTVDGNASPSEVARRVHEAVGDAIRP